MIFLIGANTLCIFICDRYASLNFEVPNPCSFSLNLLLLMENGKLLSSLCFAAVNIFIVRLSEQQFFINTIFPLIFGICAISQACSAVYKEYIHLFIQ